MGDYSRDRYLSQRKIGASGQVRRYEKSGRYRKVKNTSLIRSTLDSNPLLDMLENLQSVLGINKQEILERSKEFELVRKRQREFHDALGEQLSEENIRTFMDTNNVKRDEAKRALPALLAYPLC